MIHSLVMTNFKQHKYLEVSFDQGLNIIQGGNGAGKTTILKAILYALFGSQAVGAKEHLTNWAGGTMTVSLNVTLQGTRIVITRSLTNALVECQGTLIASGQTPVTKYVEDALGMNGKIMKQLLCAEQGETQALLKMGAAGLQSKLEIVAKIDVIDTVIKLLSSDSSLTEGILQGIGYIADSSELGNQLEDLTAQLAVLTEQQANAKKTAEFYEQTYADAVQSVDELWKLHQKRQTLNDAKVKAESLYQVANEALAQAKEACPDDINLANYPAVLDLAQVEWAAAQADFNKAVKEAGRREVLEKLLASAQGANADLRLQLPHVANAQTAFSVMNSAIELLLSSEKSMNKTSDAVKNASCATCKRPFDPKQLAQAIQEAADARIVYARHKEQADQLTNEFKAYGLSERELSQFSTNLENSAAQLARVKAELADLSEPVDLEVLKAKATKSELDFRALQGEYTCKQSLVKQLEDAKAKQTSTYKAVLQAEIEIVQAGIPSDLDEKFAHAREQVNVLGESKTASQATLMQINNAITAAKAEAKVLQVSLDEAIDKQKRQAKATSDLDLITRLQKFLRENRSKLVQDTWDSLLYQASYLIESTTEGLLSNLTRTSSGEFYICEADRIVPVDELSGARKSIVSVCLRVALSNTFYGNKGFTLLDEVTADCTDENAARVAGMLKGLNSTQVIMVSHRQGDAMNADLIISLGESYA